MGSNAPPPSRLIAATRLGHVALLNAQVGVMGGWRCERGEKCGQQNSRLLADTRLLALLSAQVGGEGGGVRLCAQGIRRGVLGGAHACVAGRPFLPPIAHCEPAHTALPPPPSLRGSWHCWVWPEAFLSRLPAGVCGTGTWRQRHRRHSRRSNRSRWWRQLWTSHRPLLWWRVSKG